MTAARPPERIVIPRRLHAGQGPWFIWSIYWGRWHRRDPKTGGASGYTDDIGKAGVFGFEKAQAYHGLGPHRRDAAVPVRRAIPHLQARLAKLEAECVAIQDVFYRVVNARPDGGD